MLTVIYDGNCNLCTTLVQGLEQLDQGQRFEYISMQNTEQLARYGIQPETCEQGMILVDQDNPSCRWQGSDAAEEIARLFPVAAGLVQAYRSLPGVKSLGDRLYAYVRDHRYGLFGQRENTYEPTYPACDRDRCALF